jgi:diguanylate cyclase
MEKDNISGIDYKLWSKKIVNFYWLLVSISILGQFVGLIVTYYYFPEGVLKFFLGKVIPQVSMHLLIMLGCEYLIKIKKVYHSWSLIIAGTLIALVNIVINPSVPGLQVTLLLPMVVALIYFEKSKLVFSFVVNLTGLTVVHIGFPPIRMATSEYEYFSYFFSLCAGFTLYLAILQRGNEVIEVLRKTSEKEKELIVKSALMERLSKTDALTGLYNHKTFHEYMGYLAEQSEKCNLPLQLAIVDIDDFKKINDAFGHSVGDTVLKCVADTILKSVSEHDIVARYGGEEFAILFTEKSFEEAFEITEAIRVKVAALHHQEIQNRLVTVSIGLKNYDFGMKKSDFFKRADALLYEAKESGKNKVAV